MGVELVGRLKVIERRYIHEIEDEDDDYEVEG